MVPISEKDWEFFSSKLIRREFAKNSIILKAGQKENYLSFIEKGIVRKCIPQEFGDLTFEFAFINNFVSAYDFFLTQEPSTYQLETLTIGKPLAGVALGVETAEYVNWYELITALTVNVPLYAVSLQPET